MRVVHISNSVSNSSANTKLHNALIKQNIDSKILVLSHTGEIAETYDLERKFFRKVYDVLFDKFEQIKYRRICTEYGFPLSIGEKGYPLYRNEMIKNADVIHLHWICGILSIQDIMKLQRMGKPIVWTCHDSWPFTGGCHVRYGCTKFMQACDKCEMIKPQDNADLAHRILKRKIELLSECKIAFIAPSKWMKENINSSVVFSNKQVINLPNAIDIYKYKPLREGEIEKVIGNNRWKGNINILFGAGDTRIPYKGYEYLIKVLKLLHESNETYVKKIVLHIVGAGVRDPEIESMYECVYWGYINELEKMVAVYNIVDIMLYPSLDDNLPNMVMESMACATPVVAFKTGGIPDMIDHKENGFLASYKNENEMLEGIKWILCNNWDNEIGRKARKKVVNNYSEERVAKQHIELYKSLVQR